MKFISNFLPFFELYRLKIEPQFFKRFSGKSTRFFEFGASFGILLSFFGLLVYSISGGRINELPEEEILFGYFFEKMLFPVIFLMIGWFILALKKNEFRTTEFIYLSSLPVKSAQLGAHFLLSDLFRFIWVPGGLCVMAFSFAAFSPFSFIIRFCWITFLTYALIFLTEVFIHLYLMLNKGNALFYPAQFHPFWQSLAVLSFLFLEICWIVYPELISGFPFLLILFTFLCGISLFMPVTFPLFDKMQKLQTGIRVKKQRELKFKFSYDFPEQTVFHWILKKINNPLLMKNLLQTVREKANTASLFLTAVLIVVSYLIAMNNEKMADSVYVLFGFFVIYALIFSLRVMQGIGQENESVRFIYSLPVRKQLFYLSYFIPAFLYLTGIYSVLSVLLIFSGGTTSQFGWFWFSAFFSSLILLGLGLNCSVAAYPDYKKAQMKFSYYFFSIVLLSTIFYRQRILIALAVTLFSFLHLRKTKFYRI